jgi:PKD repeat protein
VPVSAAAISGPAQLVVGEEGFYAATFSPPNASWPLELAWDNGSVGPTTAYSWTAPGLYTLTVTATNPCGQAAASFPVSVTASPCQPVATAAITGPATLVVGELALYTATVSPPTATLPLTLTWDSGAVCPTAAYSWTEPGLYTVTVTATNPCGEVSAVLSVSVTAAACRPVQTVAITGPLTPCTGQPTLYTATVFPPTATLPLTLTWDNGAVGPTAAYFWTAMGAYTLTVTATNACGQVHGDLHVLVCPEVAERRLALGDRLLVAAFRRLLC